MAERKHALIFLNAQYCYAYVVMPDEKESLFVSKPMVGSRIDGVNDSNIHEVIKGFTDQGRSVSLYRVGANEYFSSTKG